MLPGAIASEFHGQVRYIADGLGVEIQEEGRTGHCPRVFTDER
jgi:hypothetical protein